jgi:pimeloyl-ACP methyl ester carboxylesterase
MDADRRPLVGSISEKVFIHVNGSKQGMFIKGKDSTKPVLLYVHGGMPDYFLTTKYPTGFENYFVVVWWEQRGNGISYQSNLPPESITPEQLETDVITVTNYLRQRFGKEKIYLLGHSGGTFIGIQAAARAPQLYAAYIGIAQMSNQLKSEKLAYDYMLRRFKENGNKKMVRKLEAAPVTITGGIPKQYLALRDKAMHQLGIGTMHTMHSVVTGLFLPSWQFREYTLKEKINLWRAKARSGVSVVWNRMLETDLSIEVPELHIPVYFMHGIYDYTCSYTEAKAYFQQLKAPVKGFYTFYKSAHSPMFEEPDEMQHILREDVLTGTTNLADKK